MSNRVMNIAKIERVKELMKLKVDAVIKQQITYANYKGLNTSPESFEFIREMFHNLIDEAKHPILLDNIDMEISKYYKED